MIGKEEKIRSEGEEERKKSERARKGGKDEVKEVEVKERME